MADKYLDFVNGGFVQREAVQVGDDVLSAGKIPALSATGRLPATMIPADAGGAIPDPVPFVNPQGNDVTGWTVSSGTLLIQTWATNNLEIPQEIQDYGGSLGYFWMGAATTSLIVASQEVALGPSYPGSRVVVSIYLGGYSTQEDRPDAAFIWLTDADVEVGRTSIDGPYAADRGNVTSLTRYESVATIPVTASKVRLEVTMTRDGTTGNNDAYWVFPQVVFAERNPLRVVTASRAPTVFDDSSRGYAPTSHWFDATTGSYYMAVSVEPDAAVWSKLIFDTARMAIAQVALAAGSFVHVTYSDATLLVRPADASQGLEAHAYVTQAVALGEECLVYFDGDYTQAAGLDPLKQVYLGMNGNYSTYFTPIPGGIQQVLGLAKTSTTLAFKPAEPTYY